MNRRAFLASLTAFALDPERLLYRPGAKLISIPASPAPLSYEEIEEVYIRPAAIAMCEQIEKYILTLHASNLQFVSTTRKVKELIPIC